MHLERIHNNPNSKVSLTVEHIKDKFKSMNNSLEITQKKMRNFLKQKRLKFPRFYFLSDEDMFELLGKAKFPEIINKHMMKMFQGIKRLNYQVIQNKVDKNLKLSRFTEMESVDKEAITLLNPIEVDGDLINMMTLIQIEMRTVLKQRLIESDKMLSQLPSFRTNGAGFSNWIKDTPGQVLITNIQIEWT